MSNGTKATLATVAALAAVGALVKRRGSASSIYYYHCPVDGVLRDGAIPAWPLSSSRARRSETQQLRSDLRQEGFLPGSSVVWLSPGKPVSLTSPCYVIDPDKLDSGRIVPTYGAEGYALHVGPVPAEAIVARRQRGSRGIMGPMRFVRGKGSVLDDAPIDLATVIRAVRSAEADPDMAVLYHSGDASIAGKIHRGLEPHMGQWVSQVLSGATDDPDFIHQRQQAQSISYLSDEPDWVAIKVSRAIDKPYAQIVRADIVAHGHLSIFLVERDDESVVRAVDVSYDRFEDLSGRRLRWWETPLYDQGDPYTGAGERKQVPFGVEPGDYITAQSLSPDYTLTGEDLVAFLDAVGFPLGGKP